MRQILFLAHQLETIKPVRSDEHSFNLNDETVERYEDVRTVLTRYGQVMREKTSGTFRRISTPPHGLPRPQAEPRNRVLVENPQDHESTVEASARQEKDVVQIRDAFLHAIEKADAVVAMTEFESDTRGSLIEYALGRRKRVLLLCRDVGIVPPLHPMYLYREGVTYARFRNSRELETAAHNFFQNVPLRAMG
ncbi:hypothetical protein IT087_01850 [Candidatus Uhrbacteria bacterium]|nr:hypothetical protein [Candidatus Uhrbacteria bacterium]